MIALFEKALKTTSARFNKAHHSWVMSLTYLFKVVWKKLVYVERRSMSLDMPLVIVVKELLLRFFHVFMDLFLQPKDLLKWLTFIISWWMPPLDGTQCKTCLKWLGEREMYLTKWHPFISIKERWFFLLQSKNGSFWRCSQMVSRLFAMEKSFF